MTETTRVLKALANERRLAILRVLRRRRRMNVGEIAEEIRLSFRSTSRHLSVLLQADLVRRSQEGLEMHYSLNEHHPQWKRFLGQCF